MTVVNSTTTLGESGIPTINNGPEIKQIDMKVADAVQANPPTDGATLTDAQRAELANQIDTSGEVHGRNGPPEKVSVHGHAVPKKPGEHTAVLIGTAAAKAVQTKEVEGLTQGAISPDAKPQTQPLPESAKNPPVKHAVAKHKATPAAKKAKAKANAAPVAPVVKPVKAK